MLKFEETKYLNIIRKAHNSTILQNLLISNSIPLLTTII